MAHHDGGDAGAEHQRRHQHANQIAPQTFERRNEAAGRQPAEIHRKQQDQHDAEPEMRNRQPGKSEHAGAVVERRAAPQRCEDADRQPDKQRDEHRQRRKLDGHRQFFGQHGADRQPGAHRGAEVTLRQGFQPDGVLHRHRIVEAIFLPQIFDDLGVALLAGQRHRRIAGQQLLQAEHHHRHQQQCRQRDAEPAQKQGHHFGRLFLTWPARAMRVSSQA